MNQLRLCVAIACLFALWGCGGSGDSEQERKPPPVKDTAFGEMVGTMDKAKAVQDTVDVRKQDLDRELQSQEGQSEQ